MRASQAVHPHHIHLTQQFCDAVKTATAERKTRNHVNIHNQNPEKAKQQPKQEAGLEQK